MRQVRYSLGGAGIVLPSRVRTSASSSSLNGPISNVVAHPVTRGFCEYRKPDSSVIVANMLLSIALAAVLSGPAALPVPRVFERQILGSTALSPAQLRHHGVAPPRRKLVFGPDTSYSSQHTPQPTLPEGR